MTDYTPDPYVRAAFDVRAQKIIARPGLLGFSVIDPEPDPIEPLPVPRRSSVAGVVLIFVGVVVVVLGVVGWWGW